MAQGAVQYSYMIGKQSTWSSTVTCTKDVGIVTNVTMSPSREVHEIQGISDIEVNSNEPSQQVGNHTLDLELQHTRMFEFILGAASHNTSSSDTVHTFAVDNSPPSFTAGCGNTVTSPKFGWFAGGCMIESASLDIDNPGVVHLTCNVKSKMPRNTRNVPSHVVSALPNFVQYNVSLLLNGVAVAQWQKIHIGWTKVLKEVPGVTSADIQGLVGTQFKVDWNVTFTIDADTYHALFTSDGITSIALAISNGVASGSGKRGLNFAFNDVETSKFDDSTKVGDLTIIEMGGVCKVNTATGTDNIASGDWV